MRRWSRPGLCGLDRQLDALLDRDNGTFFEAGAHDGFTQSNTYFLERFRGWTGVLVEPVPELYAKAAARRTRSKVVQCALVAPEAAGKPVRVQFGDLMSSVGDDPRHAAGGLATAGRRGYAVEVPGRTLDEVLREAGVAALDLMVLDLEGHELDALRGMDFDRVRCQWLVIELLDPSAQRPFFDHLLAPWFVATRELSPVDVLYVWRR